MIIDGVDAKPTAVMFRWKDRYFHKDVDKMTIVERNDLAAELEILVLRLREVDK